MDALHVNSQQTLVDLIALPLVQVTKSSPTGRRSSCQSDFPRVTSAMAMSSSNRALRFLQQHTGPRLNHDLDTLR